MLSCFLCLIFRWNSYVHGYCASIAIEQKSDAVKLQHRFIGFVGLLVFFETTFTPYFALPFFRLSRLEEIHERTLVSKIRDDSCLASGQCPDAVFTEPMNLGVAAPSVG